VTLNPALAKAGKLANVVIRRVIAYFLKVPRGHLNSDLRLLRSLRLLWSVLDRRFRFYCSLYFFCLLFFAQILILSFWKLL